MKKALRLSALLIVVFALVLLASCEQDPIVQITPTPTIRGTVSIPESAGLSGSDFFIRIMEGENAVYTGKVNSDGSFSVSGLKEDAKYNILLTTEEPGDIKGSERDISKAITTGGYGGWMSNVSASINEQAGIGSIKVKPLGTIKGVVTKDGADDGYDSTVYIPGTSYLAMTDGQGNYSIFNVPQSTYTLRFIANGYMAKMVNDVVLYTDSDTDNPVATVATQNLIKNAGNLVGTISKIGATDHSNITVMLSDGENTFTGSTAVDGSLLITGIFPGTYTATISSSGFVTKTVEGISIEAAKNTNIEQIGLTANGGNITGFITLNNNGDKAGVLISANGSDDGYSYTSSTDSDGTFTISNVYPGTYTITISKVGYASITIENVVSVAGQITEIGTNILNSLYGSVSGKVSLTDSIDNSGVVITLKSLDNASVAPTTLSGVDGIYSFENLSVAGQYSLTFTKDGFVSDSGKTVTVVLGTNARVDDVTLSSLASKVIGSVSLEGTENYSGVNILLISSEYQDHQYNTTTDTKGSFVLTGVIPGIYDLYVSKSNYETNTTSRIVIESSTTKELSPVSLTAKIKSITGSITLEGKDDYSGALVTATNLNVEKLVYSAITNSDGYYTLAGMIAGEYRIAITNAAYRSETLRTVNLSDEPIEMERVDLQIARGTIYGSVTLEGRTDYSGVTVEIIGKTGDEYTTITDSKGDYSFYVPQGNYAGVRASMEDYQSESSSDVISLFAENDVPIEVLMLEATHVSVFGYVDVKETDDESGVKVKIDSKSDFGIVTTSTDGYFCFDHLPVGETYTLRFSRNMCADVTVSVTTKPSNGIDLRTVNMLPDSSAIEGTVSLDGMTNNAGITVYVDTTDGRISTLTDVSGYYYIGGLSTMRSYDIHAEKDGWDSNQTTVSGLKALEVSNVEMLKLTDTTAPIITSVKLNGGANATGTTSVNVKLEIEENGSGARYMRYWWDDSPKSPWIDYSSAFRVEIPDVINREYTFYVELMDSSDNITVQSNSSAISLVGQIKTVRGRLTGNDLHWMSEQNPIVVTGNITIGSGDELIIDPGVDVLFDGNYSINILDGGKLTAVGTDDNRIVFRSSKDYMVAYSVEGYEGYTGYWSGISGGNNQLDLTKNGYRYDLNYGNHIAYCDISDLSSGLTGYLYVEESVISSSGYAIGNDSWDNTFHGCLLNNSIKGSVSIRHNKFSIVGNVFEGSRPNYSRFWSYDDWSENCFFVNNSICNYTSVEVQLYRGDFLFNTIKDCNRLSFSSSQDSGAKTYKYLVIENIDDPISIGDFYGIELSNFIGHFGEYVLKTSSSNKTKYFNSNYWGRNTSELESFGGEFVSDVSFIYDGYDDASLSVVSIDDYTSEPWSFAGYKGNELIDLVVTNRVPETKMEDDIVIPIEASSCSIETYRFSQNSKDLNTKTWIPLYGSAIVIPVNEIENINVSSDGYLTLFVQGKNGDQETPIKSVKIPRDYPRIDLFTVSPTGITDDSNVKIEWKVLDSQDYGSWGSSSKFRMYLDDILFINWQTHDIGGDGVNSTSFSAYNYPNGNHTIRFVVADRAGNESSAEIPFTINRPVPTTDGLVINDENSTIPEDGTLDVSLNITNAKHLRYVRFYSDGVNVYERYYDNNGDDTREVNYQLDAHYLKAGTHKISVELEDHSGNTTRTQEYDYTVEGDASGPVFSALTFNDGDTVSNPEFHCQMTVAAVKGVKTVYAYIDDNRIWDYTWSYNYSLGSERMSPSFTHSLREHVDGEIKLMLKAIDYAGNETVKEMTLDLQKEWPTVNVVVYDKKTSFSIKPEVSNIYNINYIRVFVDGTQLMAYNVKNENGSWMNEIMKSKTAYSIGEHTVEVEVENRAGEKRTYSGDSFIVEDISGFHENNLEGYTTFSGMLADAEQLHWTEAMSPIVITGDIIVASSGIPLVIDPGVTVYFDGDYSISVRGTLVARGTEAKPITFMSSASRIENHEGHYGTWKGITFAGDINVSISDYTCTLNSGSVMSHCIVKELSNGITGKAYIDSCTIESTRFALGSNDSYFNGVLVNNEIRGISRFNGQFVFGNEFYGDTILDSTGYDTGFKWSPWSSVTFVNNYISGFKYAFIDADTSGVFFFNTLTDIGTLCVVNQNWVLMKYNEFSSIANPILFETSFKNGIQFSNINGNTRLNVTTSWQNMTSIDMTNNYWGPDNIAELERLTGSDKNASFIDDGYDNTNYSVVDWNGYVNEPWAFAGYKGKDFIIFKASFIQEVPGSNEAKVGNPICIQLETSGSSDIATYRMGQTLEELFASAFIPYSGECVYAATDLDMDLVENGIVRLYIQASTASGTVSPVEVVSVGYDIPYAFDVRIQNGNLIDGQTFTDAGNIDWQWSLHNASNGTSKVTFELYIDDQLKTRENWNINNTWTGYNTGWIDMSDMKNGDHVIRFVVTDAVGDSSTKDFVFTVARPLPQISVSSLTNGVSVQGNDPLSFTISIENAKSLKTMRLISDGNIIITEGFSNTTNSIRDKEITIDSRYFRTGSHNLYIELEDNVGNVTNSDTYEFTVSGTDVGPTINGFDVNESQVFSDYSTEIWNLTFEDYGGVKSIEIKLDDTQIYEFHDDVYQDTYRSIPLTVRFRVPSFSNGNHEITIKACDYAGNETSLSRSIIINKKTPTATLSLNQSSLDHNSYRVDLSNMGWIYDGCLLIDEIPVKYYFFNFLNSDDSWADYNAELYYDNLPAGTHVVKAKFTTQGGDVFYSNELQIEVDRAKDSSKYGVGKTWNEDGSLMPESGTRYLWGFNDEFVTNYETISGDNLGLIKNTVEGIGSGAASMYYEVSDLRIPFFSSEWTVEYWMKDEYPLNDYVYLCVGGIMKTSQMHHNYFNNYSEWYTTPLYISLLGETTSDSIYGASASRTDYSEWHHYALVSTGDRFEMYMDGVMVVCTTGGKPAPTVGTGLYINMENTAYIDELRISATAKSVDELWDYVQYVKNNGLWPE